MKLAATIFSLAFMLAPDLAQMRTLYLKAAGDEKSCLELVRITKNESSATAKGYHGVANMMMAAHLINPASKLSCFKSGRKVLEQAISIDPGNTELRFLRFCVQCEIPSFLGYKSDLGTDKSHLLNTLPNLKDPALKRMIVNYLKGSEQLSANEKSRLK